MRDQPKADSREWWQEVAQGLGVKAFSAKQTIERLQAERDLYRGTLVGLLPICDAEPGPLTDRIKRYIRKALR